MLSSGERNIRTTAKRAGRDQMVHSLPDARKFLHVLLSHSFKSASDAPSWYQNANIRVNLYYNVPFSHLLVPQNKQTAWVKECIPPHTCQKSLAHSVSDPINYAVCSSWMHTALFSHLLHSLAVLEGTYFSSLSFFLSFC